MRRRGGAAPRHFSFIICPGPAGPAADRARSIRPQLAEHYRCMNCLSTFFPVFRGKQIEVRPDKMREVAKFVDIAVRPAQFPGFRRKMPFVSLTNWRNVVARLHTCEVVSAADPPHEFAAAFI